MLFLVLSRSVLSLCFLGHFEVVVGAIWFWWSGLVWLWENPYNAQLLLCGSLRYMAIHTRNCFTLENERGTRSYV